MRIGFKENITKMYNIGEVWSIFCLLKIFSAKKFKCIGVRVNRICFCFHCNLFLTGFNRAQWHNLIRKEEKKGKAKATRTMANFPPNRKSFALVFVLCFVEK